MEFEMNQIKEYNRLSKASDIRSTLSTVSALLEGRDSAVINSLNTIIHELKNVSEFDDSILAIQKRMVSNRIDLEDLILDIQVLYLTLIQIG